MENSTVQQNMEKNSLKRKQESVVIVQNAPEHDSVLKDIYLSLSEQEQSSWLTERELSREYQDNDYSVCDAAFVSEETGELFCIEVTTQNYDGTETHMQFAESIGGTYVEYAS